MKNDFRVNKYLILVFFACLSMSIGYAAISAVSLNITGDATATAQSGVFISDVVCASGGNVLGTAQTTLNSYIILANNDSSSTVTCTLTIFNNTNVSYYYDDLVYDDTNPDFYSNIDIVPSVDVNQNDEIISQGTMTIHVTFGYDGGVTPSSNNNTLTSYINFRFVDTIQSSDIKLVDAVLALVDGKTPTNGVYSLGNGASGCSYKLAYDGTYNGTYEGTSDNNLRFVGSNPCNYVSLGGETWRIIGVMNGISTEPLIKLVNNDYYNNGATIAFHSKNNVVVWTSSDLYNTLSALPITNNSMVESVAWFNGGPSSNTSTATTFYNHEKATTTSLIKIGLINVSDYGFATDNISSCRGTQISTWGNGSPKTNCVTNHNWLYYSSGNVLTTSAMSTRYIYRINSGGASYTARSNDSGVARTVIYLKNSVLVDSGDGDQNTPYTLK